ncbi:DEAD/DEAH box helicase [Achromobacter denitrificans]|uniref:ATP-dependent RNA helicase RhlE n=2 Tax=Achromobacter denitrificans TaxID=32002 RepID=A0A6N0JSN9_ACHDE|nr:MULTISPECIES: DEAD/DEAH box helicase [Achromobacter]MDF3850508.1 DEAD/DEAH box helicase [Achromobacter denitrificans]QCS62942.1 DEAD/DEAH box helicase [Achromobacter denitrificans]QKQ50211.1 DEAD/DEAH box helicase [Achromobacter denitrificans]WFC68115.1 DEAD/DEAH box helicase [Achromobacter denitrificans]
MTTSTLFADLGLADSLLRAITETGYTAPTPIQAQAIPQVLKGGDLLAAAQTGTGKTAGFTLPILHLLMQKKPELRKPGRPRCLILTPTRELTAQVEESVQTYGKYTPLTSMVMFGGVNINPQISALRKPLDILVATPGRLLDHCGQKTVDLSGVEILVLDEADRMLDMGFIRDIRKILALLPKQRQNLLFSATFSDEIRTLARGVLNNPGEVSVTPRNTATELVTQTVHLVEQHHKRDLISHIIRESGWHQVLVFTRTKHGANRLAEKLVKDGLTAAAIHGNKSQSARTRALAGFKDNTVTVLVATDIAARGLDIDQLPQVVNFELPNVPEDYVHRIGRTGRAGATGSAISLVDNSEIKLLKDIERLIKKPIERRAVEGWTPPATTAASYDRQERDEDNRSPRGGGGRNGGRGGNGNGNGGRSRPAQGQGQPRAAAGGRAPAPARAGGEGRASHGPRDGKPADRPAHAGRGESRPQQNHRRPEGSARPAGNGGSGRPSGAPRAALLSK